MWNFVIYPRSALALQSECQDFSLGEPERIDNTSLYWPWMKSYVSYISQKRSGITLNARTSAWVDQKGYTTLPYIDHEWKAMYVVYPRSTQALHWMPGLQPGWTRKDRQHFPILTMNEKLCKFRYPRSAQALHWMPGLQPGWTRKDRQHFPILTMNEKLSYISQKCSGITLMPGLQPGWTRKDRQHFPRPWIKSSVRCISQKCSGIPLNARTSAWVNQKG